MSVYGCFDTSTSSGTFWLLVSTCCTVYCTFASLVPVVASRQPSFSVAIISARVVESDPSGHPMISVLCLLLLRSSHARPPTQCTRFRCHLQDPAGSSQKHPSLKHEPSSLQLARLPARPGLSATRQPLFCTARTVFMSLKTEFLELCHVLFGTTFQKLPVTELLVAGIR